MNAQVSSFVFGGLFYLLGSVAFVVATIVGVICTTCSDLIKQEAATRLERLPLWLLRRAACGLPNECREEILATEWVPEILHISRESDGLPITRLWRSVKFATNLFGGPATTVGKLLKPVRASGLPRPNDQPDKLTLIPARMRRVLVRVFRRRSTLRGGGPRIPAFCSECIGSTRYLYRVHAVHDSSRTSLDAITTFALLQLETRTRRLNTGSDFCAGDVFWDIKFHDLRRPEDPPPPEMIP